MRAFARFLVKDRDRADDLVQDAIVRVLSAAEQFEPGTNFKAWAFTILRNLYYNELRRNGRFVDKGEDVEVAEIFTAVKGDQDSTLDFRDFFRAFWQLDESQREVLMLVGASGLSYEDASKICGCKVGTIKSRVSRARQQLKSQLDAIQQNAEKPAENQPKEDQPNENQSTTDQASLPDNSLK